MTAYLTADQKLELGQEVLGRLTVALATAVTGALDQNRDQDVSANYLLLAIAAQFSHQALNALETLKSEIADAEGEVPGRTPLACPSRRPDGEQCTGHLLVERRLFEQVPVVGIEDAPAGPVYVEGVRSEIDCDEAWVGICSQCDLTFVPDEYRALTAAASTSRAESRH